MALLSLEPKVFSGSPNSLRQQNNVSNGLTTIVSATMRQRRVAISVSLGKHSTSGRSGIAHIIFPRLRTNLEDPKDSVNQRYQENRFSWQNACERNIPTTPSVNWQSF